MNSKYSAKSSIHVSFSKRTTLYCVYAMILSFTGFGCKKFVEINPPISQLVTADVFTDVASATSAQTVIYSQMASNGESYTLSMNTGLLSDELKNWSSQPSVIQFYTNSMKAVNNPGPWVNAYNYIYQANAIIQGMENSPALPSSVSNQLIGESKFIRAFWYFYLTNLYGDVPLILSTAYNSNASLAREGQSAIYAQVKADLMDAKNLLNETFVDATDTTPTIERVRPSKWAASALLARVYLYTNDYMDASTEASLIINNTGVFNLAGNLNDVFLRNSSEAIWQLQVPLPTTINTADGHNFILPDAPYVGNTNNCTISSQLQSAFENEDQRQFNWIHNITVNGQSYSYPFKYKVYASTDVSEYTMVLRLAEQYLLRAEAQAQMGNTTAALGDLDVIRRRAGLADYTGLIDKTSLVSAILHEKQVEFFTEWGHRWLDLKRTQTINQVMGVPGNVCYDKSGNNWNAVWQLYPIPQKEMAADQNLMQNSGY